MRLRFAFLLGLVLAEYKDFQFIYLSNTVPSNGVVASYPASQRPLELMWLEDLQKNNEAIVDLDIAKMIVQSNSASRVIRKYRKSHGNQRALIDYLYVFVIQVITDSTKAGNADLVAADVLGTFPTAEMKDSADWTSVMNAHTITFQTPGMLHGDCATTKSECRDVMVTSNFCYDTHVVPFNADDQVAFDDRAANVTATFNALLQAGMASEPTYDSSTVSVVSITPNFPAGQETSQTIHVGNPGDAFYAKWDFVKSITENIHTVCMKMDSTLNEVYGQAVKADSEWMDVMGVFIGTLNKDKINSQAVDYSFSCVAPACDPAPVSTRCEGQDTYNEDLTDNGFLSRLGQGLYVVKVIKGRGFEGKPPNKPAVGYWDEPYGTDMFHLEGDTVRLGCKLGFSDGVAKPFVGSVCTCAEGVCQFELANPDFICISEDEQAMPVWTGGVFNFVKAVYQKYIVLKARVANLLNAKVWPFDKIDTEAHPEYLDPKYWDTADFTLFVFCPFDVTLGGVKNGTGLMTFPDFYPGEHSDDGMLWSFLSREGTKLNKPPRCEENADTGEETCVWRSSYFKGFVDRSDEKDKQGPIEYRTDFQTEEDYSCETGILAGHHPHAIFNLKYYYPVFADGFAKMIHYLRNPPPYTEEDLLG